MNKGLFLVLDGNDGSGKATQTELLGKYLEEKGHTFEKIDFPRYEHNVFGKLIGECLTGQHGDFLHLDPKIASTLYAADRFESTPHIKTALENGSIVISDRFSSSNQIHQGGKIADEQIRTEFIQWLDHMEHELFGIPRPDSIIYLKVPVEISLKLLTDKRKAKNQVLEDGQKDMVEEDRAYLERSHETANWLASHQPNWHIIDCSDGAGGIRTREDIHEEVRGIISNMI